MKTELHKKSWGHELWMVNIPKYCGKILTVEQGKFCSLHCHTIKEETFYVLKGSFEITRVPGGITAQGDVIEKAGSRITATFEKGAVIHIPPMLLHRFKGLEVENQLIEISTQHFEDDSYRIEPSYQEPTK